MAKGKNKRCAPQQQQSCNQTLRIGPNGPTTVKQCNAASPDSIVLAQEAIERHWEALPPEAKGFILDSPDGMFPLQTLIKFWSKPHIIECTSGSIAGSICGAAWYLALVYLRMRRWNVARALTINGAFIHQCYNSSLDDIIEWFEAGVHTTSSLCVQLPYYYKGWQTVRSAEDMEKYIRSYLPKEYTQMMTSFANLSTSKSRMGYINQISDDWKGTTARSSAKATATGGGNPEDDEQITIVLVEGGDSESDPEKSSFDVSSSTTLKALFNDYADKRGKSLRTLRFSYAGKTLFLSSAGNKTPKDLGMSDVEVIEVHDTSASEDSSSDASALPASPATTKKSKKRTGKKGGKGKKKKPQSQPPEKQAASLEDCRVQHSRKLTELHDEAADRFKSIRMRLNNLAIERSQPKTKRLRPRPKSASPPPPMVDRAQSEGLGGKAGKSHFEIQVGEVRNLYKTAKHAASGSDPSASLPTSTLDLHGRTREEALERLDEALEVWVDEAMRGSYPFVRPASIVCGCGNQILSEVVQEWIRTNERVSNALKGRGSRRRGIVGRAA
ncbi:hypothetical protein ACHAWF_013380 [Thalassiosira exigua]